MGGQPTKEETTESPSAEDSGGGASHSKRQPLVVKLLQSLRSKTGKIRAKQSKIEISGKKKKKFVLTLPDESTSSSEHDPKKLSRDDDSIVLINDSDSSGVTTHSSSHKRKIDNRSDNRSDEEETKHKQPKKDVKVKNGKAQKMPKSKIEPEPKQKIPTGPGQELLDDFLNRKDIQKWRYVVDVISNEDCEALLILIDECKEDEVNMLLKEEMKNKLFVKTTIKEEQQTDGSCNRQSDSTGVASEDDIKKRMKCRKNLEGEFYVYTYVGNQKRMLKLIQDDTAESESNKTSAKETETSDSDAQSEGQKKISSEVSIVEVDTEESIQELLVVRGKPEEIIINSDSDRNSSNPNTASIYADHIGSNKSRLSLQTVSHMSLSLSTTDGYEMETTDTDTKWHVTDLSQVPTVEPTELTEKTTEKGKPFHRDRSKELFTTGFLFCNIQRRK